MCEGMRFRAARGMQPAMATLVLRAGRVKPVYLGHPWIFAQAVDRVEGAPGAGDPVEVRDPRGNFIGRGFWSPKSAIPVRLVTRHEEERLDEAALARRLDAAMAHRRSIGLPDDATTAYRLVHAEGDALPGLVVDVFGSVAVLQIGTAGMRRHRDALAAHVARVSGAKTVVSRAVDLQRDEGFADEEEVLRGPEPTELRFRERGFEITIPRSLAQKTGYYVDQRRTRARVEALVRTAGLRSVLDLYSYVGPIALSAARGGAERVLAVDSSAPAVAVGGTLATHHDLTVEHRCADVKKLLPELKRARERFDLVVCDPPKLVPTRRHLDRGERAYGKLNAEAMSLVADGGFFVTCSCSAAMDTTRFLRMLAEAASRAGRQLTLLETDGAPADHPTPIAFPEGRYLDVVIARVSR